MTGDKSYNQASLQGAGVGLRDPHVPYILEHKPNIPWLEVVTDNYLVEGGPMIEHLHQLRHTYPVAMHGVGMSIGSTDPLDYTYLSKVRDLAEWLQPLIISDHLCWVSVNQQQFHDLLPLPYTQEAVEHTAQRIQAIQDFLGQTILIENVSSYLNFEHSEMSEWLFLKAVAEQADCGILLDINNIYVNSYNHGFNPDDYLNALPPDRVQQFHLAGFENQGDYLLDSHSQSVYSDVWSLYRKALKRFGPVPTLIEWDTQIPDFPTLYKEAETAQYIMDEECQGGPKLA